MRTSVASLDGETQIPPTFKHVVAAAQYWKNAVSDADELVAGLDPFAGERGRGPLRDGSSRAPSWNRP